MRVKVIDSSCKKSLNKFRYDVRFRLRAQTLFSQTFRNAKLRRTNEQRRSAPCPVSRGWNVPVKPVCHAGKLASTIMRCEILTDFRFRFKNFDFPACTERVNVQPQTCCRPNEVTPMSFQQSIPPVFSAETRKRPATFEERSSW